MTMAKIRKKSAVPVYTVAIIWALWATCLPMYKMSNFIWLAIWSFLAYKLTGLIWRGKWVEVAAPEPAFVSTGNAELDELVRQGHEAIGQMRQLNNKIKDEKLSGQIDRLESLTDNIFKHVAKNPGKISQIRKFMNYYLPTTLKLLTSYAELAAQGVQGKNITATMTKIETIMDTIVVAFEKQLDSLFSSDALDISTDITVLEGMLQREGLTVQAMRMDK
jgi:hypothetical protein